MEKFNVKEPKRLTSTPVHRGHFRESLGLITKNTVLKMVNAFTQPKKNICTESQPDCLSKDKKSSETSAAVTSQISFFNDLSSVKETSSFNCGDSGYDSAGFRERSKSTSTTGSIQSNILASYSKYPNFKWSYLKYFGEDPTEYLSRFNVVLDTIDEISTGPNTISPNQRFAVGGKNNNDLTFNKMRRRSQTFNAKTLNRPTNIIGKYRPNSQLNKSQLKLEIFQNPTDLVGQVKTVGAKDITCHKQEKWNRVSHQIIKASVDEEVASHVKMLQQPKNGQVTSGIDDLKSRIQKSIDYYESKRQARKMDKSIVVKIED